MKFIKKEQFFQAYAAAMNFDFGTSAVYADMLEKANAHLKAELEKIKPGSSIEHATRFTLIPPQEAPASEETVLCAYRVVQDLRDEGYDVEVGIGGNRDGIRELTVALRLI